MKPSLFIIAAEVTPELAFLLKDTQDAFQLTLLTEKQDSFSEKRSSFLEKDWVPETLITWECFETYSFKETTLIITRLLAENPKLFHFIIPPKPSLSQCKAYTLLASFFSGWPHTHLTHSRFHAENTLLKLWYHSFQNFSHQDLSFLGHRFLWPLKEANPSERMVQAVLNSPRPLYILPDPLILERAPAFCQTIADLFLKREIQLEIWQWEKLSLRQQNRIRPLIGQHWHHVQLGHPRRQLQEWATVSGLFVLMPSEEGRSEARYLDSQGSNSIEFDESDLIDLALHFKIPIIFSMEKYRQLKAPWRHGDTCWVENLGLPNEPLSFEGLSSLHAFRNQEINRTLRQLCSDSK